MNFSNHHSFEAVQNNLISNEKQEDKKSTEAEILNSEDIELIVKYAKENRSQKAIDKARELLDSSREKGEEIVQNFLNSFKECERDGKDYLDFENTESGKLALSLLEKMPEPFKASANKKLEDYKKELEHNTELFRKYKNNPEAIWKKIFGFDYYNIPEFKERFKTFLFKSVAAISKEYYKDNTLYAKQDPFAISFFVGDQKNFDRVYNKDKTESPLGFSSQIEKRQVNVINTNKLKNQRDIDKTFVHESEHSVDAKINLLKAADMCHPDLTLGTFSEDQAIVNNKIRSFLLNSLKMAKDEIFANKKEEKTKDSLEKLLFYRIKTPLFKEIEPGVLTEVRDYNHAYDYNEELREANYRWIEVSKILSETEKQKLKDAIDFLQSEYDRVLKNMVDVVYENNKSVEFLRNVPINELWKYSDNKYKRTDFIIREFKF